MTRPPGRRRVLMAPLAVLAGCGFHPLYGRGDNGALGPVQDDLAAVAIGLIPERSGQLLRQALQARFEAGGAGIAHRYDLSVAYALASEGDLIQPDTSVTRIRISAVAAWTLRSQSVPPATLGSGTARALDGFDIIANQYFELDLNNDAVVRRIANTVADEVTQQVAAYFRRHPASV